MNIFFTKPKGKSFVSSSKRHKKQRKYYDQHRSLWARYVLLAHKMKINGHFMAKRQGMKNIFDWG
jgi:hypothetical protein